jgi:predicted RND superfamily exporter protein
MEKIANFIYDRARLIILIVVVLNIVSLASFYRFSLDTDFISFFSGDNPKAAQFDRLNEKYQGGETISVLIEDDDSLLDQDNLSNVFRIQEEIDAIEGISMVQSFLPPSILLEDVITPVDDQFISENYTLLKGFIENEYFLTEQFLAPDSRKGVVVATLIQDATAGDVVGSLKQLTQNESDLTITLAGNEIIKDTLWGYLIRIITVLMPCAIILVLTVFYLVLRSRLLTALAWLPAAFAGLWIFGTVFWSGQGLNIVTVLTPMFIIVIGSAFGLHYVSHFMENFHKYSDRRQLTVETLRMVGTPIFLAAITTMAGFASLTWAKVVPMREMGIFVTLGIGYAGFLALFFVPAVLSIIRLPSNLPDPKQGRMSRFVLAASRLRDSDL